MVGFKIKEALESQNKSQYWLSKESGVSASYINDLVNGKCHNPSVTKLQSIAKALKISVTKLLDKAS